MKTKEVQETIVEAMKQWQQLETTTISDTAKIMSKTTSPLIRLVAEIIQRDSAMHHRVQQMIIDSYTRVPIPVPVDELETLWSTIEAHAELEKKAIGMAVEALGHLKGTKDVVQQYLLSYLQTDEEKHDKLLDDLALIKKGMLVS